MSQRKENMRPTMKKIRLGIPLTSKDKAKLRRQLVRARKAKLKLAQA